MRQGELAIHDLLLNREIRTDGGRLFLEHVFRHELAARVVAVRIVGLKHAQPVLDRDTRRDHQEAAGESLALRARDPWIAGHVS